MEADALGGEGDVGVLGDVLGVDDHAVAWDAAVVEDFGEEDVEGAEFRDDCLEVDAPYGLGVGGSGVADEVELVELLDELGSSDEDFAGGACAAGEGFAHEVGDGVVVEGSGTVGEFFSGLVPDALGEVDAFAVGHGELGSMAEEVGFLDAHAHVHDGGFFLVGEAPADFFVGEALEEGFFDLGFEDLTVVEVFLGQGVVLRGLDVELACGAAHADDGCGHFDFGDAAVGGVDGDEVDAGTVGGGYVGDEGGLGASGGGDEDLGEEDGLGFGEETGVDDLDGEGVGGVDVAGGDGGLDEGLAGFHVDGVVVDFHGACGSGAGEARDLVDGGGGGSNFDDALVD